MIWCLLPSAVCNATRPEGSARSGKRLEEAAAAAATAATAANGFEGTRLRGTLGSSAGVVARMGEIPKDGGTFGVISLEAAGPAGTGVVGLGDALTGAPSFPGVAGVRDGDSAAGRGVRAFERV